MADDIERRPLILQSSESDAISTPDRSVEIGRYLRDRANSNESKVQEQWKPIVACVCILLSKILEAVAFYGLMGNLNIFLNQAPLQWVTYHAASAVYCLVAVSYTAPLLGGWLADTYFGRLKVMALFYLVYIAGYSFFPLLAPDGPYQINSTIIPQPPGWCHTPAIKPNKHMCNITQDQFVSSTQPCADATDDFLSNSTAEPVTFTPDIVPGGMPCGWAVFLGLTLVGLGTGVIRANIAPFGAEQLAARSGPQNERRMRAFFNWFYWCCNLGSFIALGGFGYIQQERSWFYGYLIPFICLVLALMMLLMGCTCFVNHRPGGSIISDIIKILFEACCIKCRTVSEGSDITPRPSCLDRAKVSYGGSYHDSSVDSVKVVFRVVAVFLAMTPYWVLYNQMETTYLVQGVHMNLNMSIGKLHPREHVFRIPAVWLTLVDIVIIIILLPLMDRILYPFLDRHGWTLSMRMRILIGMIFAMASMFLAGLLEKYRVEVFRADEEKGDGHKYWQKIGDTWFHAADVTILYQIPQYALIGISEAFTTVAGIELAYCEAPRSMQGLIMGLFWFFEGLGALFGQLLLTAFQDVWFFDWDYGDINCSNMTCAKGTEKWLCDTNCHLDYYFYLMGVLQLVGIFLFVFVAWKLNIGTKRPASSQRNNSISTPSRRLSVASTQSRRTSSVTSPSYRHNAPMSQSDSDSGPRSRPQRKSMRIEAALVENDGPNSNAEITENFGFG